MDGPLKQLTAAADAVVASPLPLTDDGAREFLQAHPLEDVFRCGLGQQRGPEQPGSPPYESARPPAPALQAPERRGTRQARRRRDLWSPEQGARHAIWCGRRVRCGRRAAMAMLRCCCRGEAAQTQGNPTALRMYACDMQASAASWSLCSALPKCCKILLHAPTPLPPPHQAPPSCLLRWAMQRPRSPALSTACGAWARQSWGACCS
jgi:hypothetical protein